MAVRTLIREEHGPADVRGRIREVVDEAGYALRVVRDADGRVTGLEGRSATDDLLERVAGLSSCVRELERESTRRAEGWCRAGALWVHARNVGGVAQRLRVTWPVRITWMTPAQEVERKPYWKGLPAGYRAGGIRREHVVVLRKGREAGATAKTIRHELVHCAQVERLGNKFDRTYLADDGRALEAEADRLAGTLTGYELVRSA